MEPWYDILRWFAVAVCLSQSAMFSGLNLAFFSLGRLRLEAEAEQGNEGAIKILGLRKDSCSRQSYGEMSGRMWR
jgi:metal transporter CNNM